MATCHKETTDSCDSDSDIENVIVTEDNVKEFKEEYESKNKYVNILCGGPTGVGKSTLLNALTGVECLHVEESLTRGTMKVIEKSFVKDGVLITVWDTPGLEGVENADAGYMKEIKEKCADFDLFLYCIKSTETRATELLDEKSSLVKFTKLFGPKLWKNAVVVLTYANALLAIYEEEREVDPRVDPNELFQETIDEWQTKIREELKKLKVPNRTVKKVPILPAGVKVSPNLPGHPDWLKAIFTKILGRLKYKAKMAWIQVNGLAGLTGGGFAVATTATGATVGALIGALAIGVVSFGVFAGVGLILGGIIGGSLGTPTGIAVGAALRYFMKKKLKRKKRNQSS